MNEPPRGSAAAWRQAADALPEILRGEVEVGGPLAEWWRHEVTRHHSDVLRRKGDRIRMVLGPGEPEVWGVVSSVWPGGFSVRPMAITDHTTDRAPEIADEARRLISAGTDDPDLRHLLEVFEDAGKRLLSRVERDGPRLRDALGHLADARDAAAEAWADVNG